MTGPAMNTNLVYKFTGTMPQTQNFGVISDSETLNQAIQDNYVANRINASKDANPIATLGVTGALWYAIAQAMDKFNAHCDKPYEQTIFGKLGNWGDKISEETYIGKKLTKFTKWLGEYSSQKAQKSQIAYTLKNHSTKPEWAIARNMSSGLLGFLSNDTEEIIGKFMDPVKSAQKLEQYDLSQEAINTLANSLKGLSKEEKMIALVKEELKLLGAKPEIIAKFEKKNGFISLQKLANCLKARKLGFNNLTHYEKLKGKFLEHPQEILKVLEKGAKNGTKVSIWRRGNKVMDHLVGRTATISEYYNKYKATLGAGNKTPLGRFLAKFMGYLTEGATNRFAGGKLAVFMQAYVLGDMIVHAWNAPKGEKGKTLAERFVNDFSYFLAMPVGVWAMHKLGGFKYVGLDKAGVDKFRAALKTFNENVKNNKFTTKEAYNAARKDLINMLGLDKIKNPFKKLLQKAGSFLNIGNEHIKPYLSKNKFNFNWFRKFFNGNIIGVPMRVIIALMFISPLIAKATTKVAHAIFGRPTYSVLDEGKEFPEEQNTESTKLNTGKTLIQPQQNTNLLNKYKTT